jgi:hypothetical protein
MSSPSLLGCTTTRYEPQLALSAYLGSEREITKVRRTISFNRTPITKRLEKAAENNSFQTNASYIIDIEHFNARREENLYSDSSSKNVIFINTN